MATEIIVPQWHPLDNPECTNCRGLSKPRRKWPKLDCPATLPTSEELAEQVAKATADNAQKQRERLRALIQAAELPQATFALILGVDEVTVYRYLRGDPIPRSKQAQLRAIDYIKRDGAYVHVGYQTLAPSPRWDLLFRRRAEAHPTSLVSELPESDYATSPQ